MLTLGLFSERSAVATQNSRRRRALPRSSPELVVPGSGTSSTATVCDNANMGHVLMNNQMGMGPHTNNKLANWLDSTMDNAAIPD